MPVRPFLFMNLFAGIGIIPIVFEQAKNESEMDEKKMIEILYTNWRGDMEKRRIIPKQIHFGTTEWHVREQWLMDVYDVEKNAERTFALKDIQAWLPQEMTTVPL